MNSKFSLPGTTYRLEHISFPTYILKEIKTREEISMQPAMEFREANLIRSRCYKNVEEKIWYPAKL